MKLLGIIVLLAASSCSSNNEASHGDQKDYSLSAEQNNVLMQHFIKHHPKSTILKYAQADLDNDTQEDLIIIYRLSTDKNMLCIIHHREDALLETNSVPAPVSDQMIQFRNIDEKPPLEFIVQGRKGAKVGYAIFRLEDGTLSDLFGEGMEDCC
jgi:hypothetical protein